MTHRGMACLQDNVLFSVTVNSPIREEVLEADSNPSVAYKRSSYCVPSHWTIIIVIQLSDDSAYRTTLLKEWTKDLAGHADH